jgi:hypothetical protein
MSLHPEIQRLLSAFERRRRLLLLLRGALSGGAVFLLGTLLAVMVDAPLVLEDIPRMVLAGLVYGGTLVAFWGFALRRLRAGSPARVAALLEMAAPQLRGSVLSAVELAPSAAHSDSNTFRESLQEQTARQIGGLSVSSLLPFRLVRRDFAALLLAALALGIGFALNGSRFGWQCARALLPLANFERLADAEITVLQPSPREGMVPADEPLEVEVSVVAPGEVEPVVLARHAGGARLRIPMRASGPGRFQANVPVERVPLVYQVRAGYSVTRRFQLEPRPRPRVASYTRTYRYPEYTGLPERIVKSEEGSVSALEGTQVEISVVPDQAVSGGALALTLGQSSRELPLDAVSGNEGALRASFEVTESGAYTVRMVSAETGLRSAGGPQHAIQVELDAPPNLVLELPSRDLVSPLGEKVWLEGAAEDDFGLVTVELEVRQNESGWQRKALAATAGRKFAIQTAFDSLAYKARPGDVLSVRFSATDARGQRGESRTLRIAIAPPGTVALPDRALAAQRMLFKQVKEFANESAEAVAALEKLKSQSERGVPDAVKDGEALVRAEQALEKALQAADAARATLRDARLEAGSALEEAGLRVEERVLGAAQLGELQAAKQALRQLLPMAGNKAATVEAARFAKDAAAAGASLARLVEEAARARLNVMEAAALAPAARALSSEIAAIAKETVPETVDTPQATGMDDVLRRQQVNQTASSQLQGQLQSLAERAQPAAGALRPALEELRKSQAAAEKATGRAAAGEGAQPPAQDADTGEGLARSLERTATSLESTQPALQAAAERAQAALKRADRTGAETVERSARDMASLANKQNVPAELREAEAAILAGAAADTLRADADAESVAAGASPKLARALVQAAAALEVPAQGARPVAGLEARGMEVAKLLRTVEGGAALKSAHLKAEDLSSRLNRQNGPPSPLQMEVRQELREEVQALQKPLREARLPEAAGKAAREAGDALGGSATEGLAAAGESLKAGVAAASEAVDRAMAELAGKAPSLPEQMGRLAAGALSAAEATAALAKKTGGEVGNQGEQREVGSALRKEAEFERKLDQLRQALRAEANAQEVRSEAGREAARDADGAVAQLRDAGNRAEAALQQAVARAAERQPLLEKAAAFQKQGAEKLRNLAEHFQKLESADPAERAAARQALRAGDKESGAAAPLDARRDRMAELAKLAELARSSPQAALAQAEAMARSNPDSPVQTPGTDGAAKEGANPQDSTGKGAGQPPGQRSAQKDARGGAEGKAGTQMAEASKGEMAEARAALKEGGEGSAERAAQSLSAAVDAQAAADRGERAQEGAASTGGANSGADLSGMADAGAKGLPGGKRGGAGDWGNLPKRLATDMLEGKRESAPSEYRDSVEAYFRAVAERARSGGGR